jgi:hypothetical protein
MPWRTDPHWPQSLPAAVADELLSEVGRQHRSISTDRDGLLCIRDPPDAFETETALCERES